MVSWSSDTGHRNKTLWKQD